jgi:7-carboxy-7-deazaguanine synthase
MNEQTKTLVEKGEMLPLMEAFYTVQGEGFHSGRSAYFLRIGGCDVGCHWCDVKESWDAELHPPTPIQDMQAGIVEQAAETVVVTGGEPLMWNMQPLTDLLHAQGLQVHIETSGAYPLSGDFDWICLSPKKTMPPKQEVLQQADELKVIIHNKHDFKWAEEHAAQVKDTCRLYLQPEWSKSKEMMEEIVAFVKDNPRWSVSLQTHKYMNIP